MPGSRGNCYQSHLFPPHRCYWQTCMGRQHVFIAHLRGKVWWGEKEFSSDQEESRVPLWMEHPCVPGHLDQILIFRSNPKCQIKPPVGEWAIMVLFKCFFFFFLQKHCCISSCLSLFVFWPSLLFCTSGLSSLSELKETSKCLDSFDTGSVKRSGRSEAASARHYQPPKFRTVV